MGIKRKILAEGFAWDEGRVKEKSDSPTLIYRGLVTLLFCAIAGLVLAIAPLSSLGGAGIGDVVRSAVASPLSLFAARSPGVRGEVTTQSKPYRSYRVASIGRERPDASPAQSFVGPMGDGENAPSVGDASPTDTFVSGTHEPQDTGIIYPVEEPFPFFAGDPVPLPDFPFVNLPPETDDNSPDVENPPAVPEPASWIIMMLGLFFVGSALRKAKTTKTVFACETIPR